MYMPDSPERGRPAATLERTVQTNSAVESSTTRAQVLGPTEHLPPLSETDIARAFGGEKDRVKPGEINNDDLLNHDPDTPGSDQPTGTKRLVFRPRILDIVAATVDQITNADEPDKPVFRPRILDDIETVTAAGVPDATTPEPAASAGGPSAPDGGGRWGGGWGDGGRGPGGRGPEGQRGPENIWSLENEETGRGIVDQLIEMRTTMSYGERHRGERGRRLDALYNSLQRCVNELCKVRNEDSFGPHQAFPRPIRGEAPNQILAPPEFPPLPQALEEMRAEVEKFRTQYHEEDEGVGQTGAFTVDPLPDSDDDARSITARRAQYNKRSTLRGDREAARSDLLLYFKHGKNRGLLKEVDAVLNLTYQDIARPGISSEQAEELLNRGVERARYIAGVEFQEAVEDDPNIPVQLTDVGQAYIDWARRRMERSLHGQQQKEGREGEWLIPTSEQSGRAGETYWEVGSYPKYYHITAKTQEQFLTAKETFLQMIRSGSIGKSPTAIFEHVKNFIEVFGSEGGRQVREGGITVDFLEENRHELEALLYILVANYSKEVYNPQQSKEAMMAMSLDEGPARWLAAYRAGKGGVAAFTQMFDYEAEMDIFNNPVGERGELDIVAGHFLQDTIRERAIERGMGIVLKDYDPRDQYLSSDDLVAKIKAAVDLDTIKSKLEKIKTALNNKTLELPEDFKRAKLKAGVIEIKRGKIVLRQGATPEMLLSEREQSRYGAYRANLKRLGLTGSTEEFKSLYEGFDKGDTHIKNYNHFAEDQKKPKDQRQYPPLSALPESIRKSIDLGRIQVELGKLRKAILEGKIKLEKGKRATDLLRPGDRQIYKAAFDEAAANFEIAFQMQGVLGEKARRGRGFLYVDRNPYIQYYDDVAEGIRLHWIDEDKTKRINPDELDEIGINNEALKLPRDERRKFRIGWMLYKIREGKKLDTFSKEFKDLYNGLDAKEREVVVDNIPTYQLENVVQWVVTWTKMKYAGASVEVRRQKVREARARIIKEIRTNGYSAQLWDDEVGPDGQPQLIRYKRPLGRVDPSTGKFKKFKNGEILGYNEAGEVVKLLFGNDGKPAGLEFDHDGIVVYDKVDPAKRKRIRYDSIRKDTIARLVTDPVAGDTLVEEAVPTFEFAAQGGDFRSLYTVDTYWYYQGNNRATILTPDIEAAKERIALGLSRPEDEDPLALQALIVDPTRKRIKKFDDIHQQREVTLVAAAVLESFQDRMRIKHALYRAFLPKDGYIGRKRAGYRNEDWAGMDRFTFGFVELAAQQTSRFSRRLGAEIADVPLEHDSAPARWGVYGVSGAIKALADNIKSITHQGIVGQFGLTKIFDIFDEAINMYYALVGRTDPQTKEHKFGVLEKPTDNNEKMHKHMIASQSEGILGNPAHAIPFIYDLKECFGRLQTVTHIMRVMYSNLDNSQGALNLENHEIFLEDGSFNAAIESDRDILKNNGTARNRQKAFLDGEEGGRGFYRWLVDESPGGGGDVYAGEKYWNDYLFREFYRAGTNIKRKGVRVWGRRKEVLSIFSVPAGLVKDWLTDKII